MQVTFRDKSTLVDFVVLESKAQGNIVLGRSVHCTLGCFINAKQGFIRLNCPIGRKFYFPTKRTEELIFDVCNDFGNT